MAASEDASCSRGSVAPSVRGLSVGASAAAWLWGIRAAPDELVRVGIPNSIPVNHNSIRSSACDPVRWAFSLSINYSPQKY